MGSATTEAPAGARVEDETDEQRGERELREQAERLKDAADAGAVDDDEQDEPSGAFSQPVDDDAGKAGAEGGEAGTPPMPPEEPQALAGDPVLDEIIVSGTRKLGRLKAGGKAPTGATLSVQGLSGLKLFSGEAFDKGDFVLIRAVARVEDVGQKDKMDRKQNVAVDCVQRHVAYATDVQLAAASGATLPDEDVSVVGVLEARIAGALQLLEGGESAEAVVAVLKG